VTAADSPPAIAPAWARASLRAAADDSLEAAFAAGAALAALDARVREETAFAGAWRRRLALRAALACLAGRPVDATALRDALALTGPSGDPGPAGRLHAAWRALASDGRGPSRSELGAVAAGLGGPADPALLSAAFEPGARAAPLAAAAAAAAVLAAYPRAVPLAFAAADLALASRLGWRAPLPLLALEAGRARPGAASWICDCCAAYARAASRACALHAELRAAAARLEAVAPKLRAKGAPAALAALLDEDAVSGAAKIPGMSERGLRRLFDRLVALGAARELTGRKTFRLYGL
jgi:hypothetical protein